MSGIYKISGLLGRILISFIFLQSGINKIGGYKATLGYMESKGVPGMLLPLVIFLEIAGAIAIIVGWQTRLFAFALAGFCILSALLFHMDFSNQVQTILFMKNLAIAGGFLVLFAHGAGDLSLGKKG
ncbi:MAG: DoxX family protein [Deltaproteobacteria bacterium]|nr:DoxX family protein [Deltaproteobacteria bacterium]